MANGKRTPSTTTTFFRVGVAATTVEKNEEEVMEEVDCNNCDEMTREDATAVAFFAVAIVRLPREANMLI